jgi:hypothetical protein
MVMCKAVLLSPKRGAASCCRVIPDVIASTQYYGLSRHVIFSSPFVPHFLVSGSSLIIRHYFTHSHDTNVGTYRVWDMASIW